MVANVAVTIGWRVLWFVAAVAIPRLSVTAATAPQSVDASLRLKRSDTNARAEPERLGLARFVEEIAGRVGVPRERVEAQLVQSLHRSTRSSVSRALAGNTRLQQLGALETELVQDRPRVVARQRRRRRFDRARFARSAAPAPVAPHRRP